MANNYKLTFVELFKLGTKDIVFTYNQESTSTQQVGINNKNCDLTLMSFSYSKAMYLPGELLITLKLKSINGSLSFSDIEAAHNLLMSKYINVEFQDSLTDSETFSIAELFRVFDVQVEKRMASGDTLSVVVKAFDPLKHLTLDKFCSAYTCKKLIKDVIMNEKVWPVMAPVNIKDELTNAKTAMEEINKLKYELQTQDNAQAEKTKKEIKEKEEKSFIVTNTSFLTYSDNKNKTFTEFIQPYLVQYNESFLDFIVRVTNRCGEFFYFESGKIHIGWEKTEPVTIRKFDSITFPKEVSTAWAENSIADIHNDYTLKENKNLKNTEAPDQFRDFELASDENLRSIPEKGQYTSWKDFALFPGCFLVSLVSDALCSQNLADIIADLGISTAAKMSNSVMLSKQANDGYETQNFGGEYKEERTNDKEIFPFSTSDTNKSVDFPIAYSLEYYTKIRNEVAKAERSRIKVGLGDNFYPVSLGSMIKFEGDSQLYIVVSIESRIGGNPGEDGFPCGENFGIEIIPYKEKSIAYPVSAHVSPIRTSKAQRAIITHNQDPLKLNRVRVRYPWQGKTDSKDELTSSEDSTPWISIVLPMASNGSGFNFLPEVGDEAIINYESGNIERPYVEGMVYSGGQTVPCDFKRTSGRVISSVNGHSIIFSDPGKMNPVHSLSPALSTISTFIGTPIFSIDDRKAAGGIELTDEYGFYSISMSSDKRAISVDSPFGKVDINAFTGITISAPNGNIKIAGKNIDIIAGNNLTISSGNNIKNDFWPFGSPLKDFLKDMAGTAIGKLSPIDMKLIRCVMETFLRPIGGTLLIKSYRYMRLEAGKGSANILGRAFTEQRWIKSSSLIGAITHRRTKKTFKEEFTEEINKNIDIDKLNRKIQELFYTHMENHRNIEALKNGYDQQIAYWNSLRIAEYFNGAPVTSDEIINNNKKPDTITIAVNRVPKKLRATFESGAETINKSASDLYEKVKKSDKETVWKEFLKGCDKETAKIFKDQKVKSLVDEFISPAYFLDKTTYRPYNNALTSDIGQKRRIIQKAFEILVKEHNSKNPFKIQLPDTVILSHSSDIEWTRWVDEITLVEQIEPEVSLSNMREFSNLVMDSWSIGNWADQYSWDSTDDGKILFSDIKGKTLHIQNNNLEDHTYRVPDAELGRLKRKLYRV